MIKISLIIPAYNEALYLPRLLKTVDEARARFVDGPDAVEVIVADNASTDDTSAIAASCGCIVTHIPQRRISLARNGGAKAARGEILCFVDADTLIHPDTFNAVAAALERNDIVGGASGVRLQRWSLGIALTYAMFIPLLALTGMDTGVVFCRREDFWAVGGYDERRELAEDAAFLWALRRLGKKRNQRLTRLPSAKAVASMRKFDLYGDWHYFTKVFPFGAPAILRPNARTKFARRYWYGNER